MRQQLSQTTSRPQGSSPCEHASLVKESERNDAGIHERCGGSSFESEHVVTIVANEISLLGSGERISDLSGGLGCFAPDPAVNVDCTGGG